MIINDFFASVFMAVLFKTHFAVNVADNELLSIDGCIHTFLCHVTYVKITVPLQEDKILHPINFWIFRSLDSTHPPTISTNFKEFYFHLGKCCLYDEEYMRTKGGFKCL